MNSISIASSNSETQVRNSESNTSKGLANMKNYYSKTLYPYVERLIRDNVDHDIFGYSLDVDDLTIDDQYEFATHLIRYDDSTLCCISENEDHDDIVYSLFNLLKKDDLDSKLDFADLVKSKVISYYKDKMQEMIDEALPWVEEDDFIDAGYVKVAFADNGETHWVKS